MRLEKIISMFCFPLLLYGCTAQEAREAADSAGENISQDFRELGEETEDSLKKDDSTQDNILDNPSNLTQLEEDMAEDNS